MALIDARVLRSMKIAESKSDKGSVQMSASQEFLILSDVKDPDFTEILRDTTSWANLSNTRLPRLNDFVFVRGYAFYVTSRELSHYKDNERAVVMTVKYDAKQPPGGDDSNEEDPKPNGTEPDSWKKISISSQSITKPALGWRDFTDVRNYDEEDDGTGAINSAFDPVDGLEEECALVRLSYTNTQVVRPNFEQLLKHVNACNSTPFLGAEIYQIRVTGFSGEYDQKNNLWSITLEMLFNPEGWKIQYYDAGFNELVDGQRRAILDKAGNPVSSPVPLDGSGGAAAIGTEPLTRTLYPYPKANLNQIFNVCGI